MSLRRLKILVVSDFEDGNAGAIGDFLFSFQHHSIHQYYYVHSWRNFGYRRLANVDLDSFDVILFFWDCYWLDMSTPASYYYMPTWLVERIKASSALKVMFLQDEYRIVREMNRNMARLGINVMFTCVAEMDHSVFYPPDFIPSLEATYTVFPGYVPSYLGRMNFVAQNFRPIDLGYRSRQVPFHLGSVGQEKTQIAHEFTQIAKAFGFSADISVREQDRIYGKKWLAFLQSCRFSLGTESGASVIDFDGEIQRNVQIYLKEHPTASFDEVKNLFFASVDGTHVIQTISPRIFEAAAFGNTLVLHEGEYAGIVEPDVHFISVKKDYSNVDEVVARMRDKSFCDQLAKRTHADLIRSGAFSYRSFVRRFDEIICKHRPRATQRAPQSRLWFYAINYWHRDCVIPRGGSFVTIPYPSAFDVVRRIGAKGLGLALSLLAWIASFGLLFSLLTSSGSLRRQLVQASLTWDTGRRFTWLGILRDLRLLAILKSVRDRRQPYQNQFRVRAALESHGNRLVFLSSPIDTMEKTAHDEADEHLEAKTQTQMQGAGGLSSITWDHGKVAKTVPVPIATKWTCSIHVGKEGMHEFRNFHHLFGKNEKREVEVLNAILFQSGGAGSFLGKMWASLCVGLALAMLIFYQIPQAMICKVLSSGSRADPGPSPQNNIANNELDDIIAGGK